jgi:AsmA protein
MKKPWLRIVLIVVAVLIVILIALPFLINVNSYRPKIESEASSALGRPVTVGNLSLSLLSGTVTAENVAIADDPAFSKSPFVTAKSLKIGVELMPLIFSKELKITEIALEKPQITLLKAANGTWNYSTLAESSAKKTEETKSGQAAAPTNLSVGKLNINDGVLMVGRANSKVKPRVYDKVNITVTDFSATSQFPFTLTATGPGGGTIDISGKAGPINPTDAAKTPFDTRVKINHANLATTGFLDPASGIGGLASLDGTLTSNGSQAKAVGTFTGERLMLAPKASPASETVVIKHAVEYNLDNESGTLAQGDISIGKAQAHLTGTFKSEGETEVVNLKLNAPSMPVDALEAMLPALGITLPSGSKLKGGTVSANLAITGPVDKMVIAGPVKVSDTSLAGFNLGAKMGALSAFAGKAVSNPDTEIRNLSLNANVSPAGTQANDINLDVPAIGVVTGNGTISPGGALNFKMLANLHGGMVGGVSKVAGAGGGVLGNLGKGAGAGGGTGSGIPFDVEGTTSDPHVVPEMGGEAAGVATGVAKGAVGGVAGGATGAATAPAKAVGGLLGKKH